MTSAWPNTQSMDRAMRHVLIAACAASPNASMMFRVFSPNLNVREGGGIAGPLEVRHREVAAGRPMPPPMS